MQIVKLKDKVFKSNINNKWNAVYWKPVNQPVHYVQRITLFTNFQTTITELSVGNFCWWFHEDILQKTNSHSKLSMEKHPHRKFNSEGQHITDKK